ncbi:MAG: hypothetical protein WA104_01040 [Thermodesulfovibrionales bacterium]
MMIIRLFFILIFLFFAGISHAKEPLANKEHKKVTKASGKIYYKGTFDTSAEKLPPNFNGHNIEETYNLLKLKASKKGEYETTEEYKKRIAQINSENIYAFKIEDSRSVQQTYYADSQLLRIEIETRPVDASADFYNKRESFIVKEKRLTERSYIGTNAFGVSVRIREIQSLQYGLALVNGKGEFLNGNGHEIYQLGINISPDKAKFLKEKLAFLIICKINSQYGPIVFDGLDYSEPTLSNPIKLVYKINYLNVKALEIWAYNEQTGEIYLKEKIYIYNR